MGTRINNLAVRIAVGTAVSGLLMANPNAITAANTYAEPAQYARVVAWHLPATNTITSVAMSHDPRMFAPTFFLYANDSATPAAAKAKGDTNVKKTSSNDNQDDDNNDLGSASVTGIMAHIARCESGGRQFDKNGEAVRGKVNDKDIGLFQINASIWKDEAEKLGYDIFTLDGNVKMARYIYAKQGTKPWGASKPCWGKHMDESENEGTASTVFEKPISLNISIPDLARAR